MFPFPISLNSFWLSGCPLSISHLWYAYQHAHFVLSDVNIIQTLTYALYDLCQQTRYLEPLRQEVDNHWVRDRPLLSKMSLLDSFLRESARVSGSETSGSLYSSN